MEGGVPQSQLFPVWAEAGLQSGEVPIRHSALQTGLWFRGVL